MRAMLLQPFYFPWAGMFDMMSRCDLFVFYDDAQFVRGSWQSRNRILSPQGVKWLSVAIDRSGHVGTAIRDMRVNDREGWRTKHLNQLREAYRKTPHFDLVYPEVETLLAQDSDRLVDFSTGSVLLCARLLGIATPVACASTFDVGPCRGEEKVIALMRAAGADCYYDGASGVELYAPERFAAAGLALRFHAYEHPVYEQGDSLREHAALAKAGTAAAPDIQDAPDAPDTPDAQGAPDTTGAGGARPFTPYLSVLDLLFRTGPQALDILRSGNREVA